MLLRYEKLRAVNELSGTIGNFGSLDVLHYSRLRKAAHYSHALMKHIPFEHEQSREVERPPVSKELSSRRVFMIQAGCALSGGIILSGCSRQTAMPTSREPLNNHQ